MPILKPKFFRQKCPSRTSRDVGKASFLIKTLRTSSLLSTSGAPGSTTRNRSSCSGEVPGWWTPNGSTGWPSIRVEIQRSWRIQTRLRIRCPRSRWRSTSFWESSSLSRWAWVFSVEFYQESSQKTMMQQTSTCNGTILQRSMGSSTFSLTSSSSTQWFLSRW